MLIAAFVLASASLAAAAAIDTVRLSDDIVPAPFGYETASPDYVVTEATRLYVSPFIYPGTVNNQTLQPGEKIEVLAKVKDYDWVLAGKNGVGIGYIPLARVKAAEKK